MLSSKTSDEARMTPIKASVDTAIHGKITKWLQLFRQFIWHSEWYFVNYRIVNARFSMNRISRSLERGGDGRFRVSNVMTTNSYHTKPQSELRSQSRTYFLCKLRVLTTNPRYNTTSHFPPDSAFSALPWLAFGKNFFLYALFGMLTIYSFWNRIYLTQSIMLVRWLSS